MPPHNSHLTTEQLSAFLDQQLSAQEQSTCQTHLNTCELCQQQLAELQQSVLLLRALPRAPLPRSFVLPAEAMIESNTGAGKEDSTLQIARQAYKRVLVLPGYARTTMRIASTLVAVLGLFFILSGLLTIMSLKAAMPQASTRSGMSVAQVSTPFGASRVRVPNPPGASAVQVQNPSSDTSPQQPFAGAATGTQKSGPSPSTSPQQPAMSPITPFFDPGTPEGHLSIGLLLFIIGTVSVILFSRSGKQAQQDQSQQ